MNEDRVVALDLGGVLLSDGTKTAFTKLGARYGVDSQTLETLWHSEIRIPAELGLISAEQALRRIAGVLSAPLQEVESQFLGEFRPIKPAVDFLRTIRASDTVVVLATNHLDEWVERWKRTFEWFSHFDRVVCSASLGLRKPQIEFYQAVIDAAGGVTGFYFVDDSAENVAAATAVGLRGVLAQENWMSRILLTA